MDRMNQIELEKLYHKNKLLPRLKAEFDREEIRDHCTRHELPYRFCLDLLAQIYLHRRAHARTMLGILWRHFKEEENPYQTCADVLTLAVDAGLVDWDPVKREFIVAILIDATVQEEIDRYQYPLPMVIQPEPVKTNRDTGYITEKNSIILNNTHGYDVCLDHINRANQIPLAINPEVVRLIQNSWKHLDKQKDDETWKEFKARQKAFEKYDRTSRDILESLYLTDAPFYMTHKYDSRGRCYAQGYHINPQGTEWNKAVIEFHHQEVTT